MQQSRADETFAYRGTSLKLCLLFLVIQSHINNLKNFLITRRRNITVESLTKLLALKQKSLRFMYSMY